MGRSITQDADVNTTIEVDIDINDVLIEATTAELESELADRGVVQGRDEILENVYYALRDKDLDNVIKQINPLLDRVIGKVV